LRSACMEKGPASYVLECLERLLTSLTILLLHKFHV
jgi:hypothetical protein